MKPDNRIPYREALHVLALIFRDALCAAFTRLRLAVLPVTVIALTGAFL